MPRFETEVDVDVDEFIDSCSSREIEKLVQYLKDDGHFDIETRGENDVCLFKQEFNSDLDKIQKSYYLLSDGDSEAIRKIAKKY